MLLSLKEGAGGGRASFGFFMVARFPLATVNFILNRDDLTLVLQNCYVFCLQCEYRVLSSKLV